MKSLLFLLIPSLALTGCGRAKAPAPPPPVRPVMAAVAEAQDVPRYLDVIGRCAPFESVTILPQVSGPVSSISFVDGSDVAKGDLLFQIDPRPFEADVSKAEAMLSEARARASFEVSQLQRNEALRRKEVAAVQELDSARSASTAAMAAVQASEAALRTARIQLDYCTIRSPIDGRAGKRQVDAGNIVEANKTALVVIQRQDPIYVEFEIPERDLPKVRDYIAAGTLEVRASFADQPEKSRLGKFDFLDSSVAAATGTVRMRAVFDNADRLFWPGQFVDVRILLETIRSAVLVPAEAVQTSAAGPFVFVVKPDQTVDLRKVRPGQRQGDLMVIEDGVQAGEQIVTRGQLTLAPGSRVNVSEWWQPGS